MVFSVFVPPVEKAPCLFYLSGLTCTDENFVQKAGAARRAAELGIALVAPDTSPRLPEDRRLPGEDDSYDFGSGAGFYVDASIYPWSQYYNMYSFVTQELPEAVMVACPEVDVQTRSITGHSMGGHGALTIGLKQPALWRSVSAFSPICNPTKVPWGTKAFEGYLGSVDAGAAHDACELLKGYSGPPFSLLVDQGAADNFLAGDTNQLQPEALKAACAAAGVSLEFRLHLGYDHSYYFISTFIADHIAYHAKALKA
jgi:S-formylglutathione hydrolase